MVWILRVIFVAFLRSQVHFHLVSMWFGFRDVLGGLFLLSSLLPRDILVRLLGVWILRCLARVIFVAFSRSPGHFHSVDRWFGF